MLYGRMLNRPRIIEEELCHNVLMKSNERWSADSHTDGLLTTILILPDMLISSKHFLLHVTWLIDCIFVWTGKVGTIELICLSFRLKNLRINMKSGLHYTNTLFMEEQCENKRQNGKYNLSKNPVNTITNNVKTKETMENIMWKQWKIIGKTWKQWQKGKSNRKTPPIVLTTIMRIMICKRNYRIAITDSFCDIQCI